MSQISFESTIEELSYNRIETRDLQKIRIEENAILKEGLTSWIMENKPTIGQRIKITLELISQ